MTYTSVCTVQLLSYYSVFGYFQKVFDYIEVEKMVMLEKLMFSSIGYLTGMQIIYVIDRFI